ncbi:MAG: hypothetical protein RIQ41_580 [Candidatus Parcubacteria bacterium]|jgi:hypothetical protein
MDTTTLFLAQLIGPSMLAVGLGIFFSKKYYLNAFRYLEKETVAVLTTGLIALVVGLVIVLKYQAWGTPLEYIVSIIGWMSIVKGTLLLVVPRFVDRIGEYFSKTSMLPMFGAIYIVLGVYVSYIAYLM